MNDSLHEEKHREIDRLMVENDELIARFKANDIEIQNRIQALDKQLSAERKFRAEFGGWLEAAKSEADTARYNWMRYSEEIDVGLEGALSQWHELKAQHIDSEAESEGEHNAN